ncbi:MAG: hypothetical protein COW30_04220 [Rhodospirillales bacterium CG15_BIG_FIL_POST_REV_8_21_14_020_66_15]|nr:MAG: hypothetical protein COW30_04220 [Rhodospirillales bacterium CG15_BIG_FIL_POST_REV_8_21_14_020_66_15]
MKHRIFDLRAIVPLASAAAFTVVLAVQQGPALAAGDTADPPETEAGETVDAFVDWAQSKARALDSKLNAATARAADAGAEVADDVKAEWREARQAIDRQRAAVRQQIAELETAAASEWADAKEATRQGLAALGEKVEEFRALIMERDKSGPSPAPDRARKDPA